MRVLVAVDGSEHSNAAVRTLPDRPWPNGTVFRVLSVARNVIPVAGPLFPEAALNYESMAKARMEGAKALVAHVADRFEDYGLTVTTAVRLGDPRAEIVAEARDWGADLIVVGSHGRTGITRWLLGSVAEHVVRHAHCSVEVARSSVEPTADVGEPSAAAEGCDR